MANQPFYSFPSFDGGSNRLTAGVFKRLSANNTRGMSPDEVTQTFGGMVDKQFQNMKDVSDYWREYNPGYLREMLTVGDEFKQKDHARRLEDKKQSFGFNAALEDGRLASAERNAQRELNSLNMRDGMRTSASLISSIWG